MRKLIAKMVPVKKSLAKQLVRTILTAYFLFAVAVTVGQLFYNFQHEKDTQYRKIDSLVGNFNSALSEALWNFDETQIAAMVSGLLNNDEILGVAVIGSDNFRFSEGEIGSLTADHDNTSMMSNYKQFYVLFSPDNTEEQIGIIYVFSGVNTVIARASTTFIISLLAAAIKTLALWFIAVRVINRYVGKPINEIQTEILTFDIEKAERLDNQTDNNNILESGGGDNELDRLKICFEALYRELQHQNYLINNQTKLLESQVSDRTFELNQTVEELQKANAIKTNFLANISHELRTPLNAIIGFTRRLVRNAQNDKQKNVEDPEKTTRNNSDIYEIILRNSESLLDLINKMLDMSRISGGQIILNKREVDVGELLETILNQLRPLAAEKSLNLDVAITPGIVIEADPERLAQLINNLVSNAIKFTQHGTIAISTAQETIHGQSGCNISVLDTGVGISETDLPMLFQHFQKVGDKNLNTVPGTGLGLAIVYELVQLHNGEIRVDSILGKGSLFNVWLPVNSSKLSPSVNV